MMVFADINAFFPWAAAGGLVTAIVGAYIAARRAPQERDGLFISTAEGAMKIVNSMTDALYRELQRKDAVIAALDARIELLESQLAAERSERGDLREGK